MGKKEFTKKQLRKQLTVLTEAKSDIKSELKKAYVALKNLKGLIRGHKAGEQTLSFRDLKAIKNAARKIEDIWEDMNDDEMTEKEEEESQEVEKKNEQSEGHGKMYNALTGIKEGKVIKMSESTLKRVVDRVINEQTKKLTKAQIDAITAIFKKKETSVLDKIWKSIKDISYETPDGKKVIGLLDRDKVMSLLKKIF